MPSHHLNTFLRYLLPTIWKRGPTMLGACLSPVSPGWRAPWLCTLMSGSPRGTPRQATEPQWSSTVVVDPSEGGWLPQPLVGQVLPQEGAGSSLPSSTKLEAFKLSSCHHSQVCTISFLLLSANLSLAVLVVPVALLLLLAPVFYSLSVLGAACFLSGFIQI